MRHRSLTPRSPNQLGMRIQRRGAEIADISAELMPRRRRGGMGWETLAGVSPAVARRVGQAIALCGLSCFAVSRQADRRQKAIVCPTGLDAESTSCGWVSGEKTKQGWPGSYTPWRRHSYLPRPHSWGRSWLDNGSPATRVSRRVSTRQARAHRAPPAPHRIALA